MDALEFLKEHKRMCKLHPCYGGCPLEGTHCALSHVMDDEDYERVINNVEQWSKEHPRKTRQSVFLEISPNVMLDSNGIINISPCRVDPKQYRFNGDNCHKFRSCSECRREFWGQEVE